MSAPALMQKRRKRCPVLLDDLAARRFAIGLGLEVVGSVGILIKSAKEYKISKEEAFDSLEKLAKVMWLRIDVYEDARNATEVLRINETHSKE